MTNFALRPLLRGLAVLAVAASALHCGGGSEPGMESEDDALRAWGPWGSCTLIRNGMKVPAYYDAATGCCCYKGDCEIQTPNGGVSSSTLGP